MTLTPRRSYLALAALTVIGLALRLACLLGHPPTPDDVAVPLSAINYLESGQLGPTMWNHPGLRNILAYGMLRLCGPGLFGVVGLNLLLGTLSIPLTGALALRLTGSRAAALGAAFLFTVEPLAIQYSSQAINDIYLVFFPLAGMLCAYRYLDTRRPGWLIACGFVFGLGLASKWSALFQLAVAGGLLLYRLFRVERPPLRLALARLVFLISCLAVLPATLYLASFAPWFTRGYGLTEWPALQKSMYRETKLHTGYHDKIYGDHDARLWFVVPGISHVDTIFVPTAAGEPAGSPVVLLTLANPLVWLALIPALALALYRAWRRRDEGLWVLIALFGLSYLPFALVRRPIWFNTGVVVLPYLAILVAAGLYRLCPEATRRGRLAGLYLLLAGLVSLGLFLPAMGKSERLPVVGKTLVEKVRLREGVSKESFE